MTLLRLRECKASIPPHPLCCPDLLDSFLELLHSWSIVRQVEGLNLLHDVVRLRHEQPLVRFPGVVSQHEEDRKEDDREPHDRRLKEAGHNILELLGEANQGRDNHVDGEGGNGENERPRDSQESPARPETTSFAISVQVRGILCVTDERTLKLRQL